MKIISGIITAMLLALGLLAVTAPAQAADYPPSIHTTCTVRPHDTTLTSSQRLKVAFRVSSNGAGSPAARINITFKNVKTGAIRRATTRVYNGGTAHFSFASFKPGRYRVVYKANPRNDRFYNCSTSHALRVRG